jgi:hypothetical protein
MISISTYPVNFCSRHHPLKLIIILALGGFPSLSIPAQDTNASPATIKTPAGSQPSGPVIDPAAALPDITDRTPFPPTKPGLPTLFLCGDSTMDSRPNPKEPLVANLPARIGWGGSVIPYFDTSNINPGFPI